LFVNLERKELTAVSAVSGKITEPQKVLPAPVDAPFTMEGILGKFSSLFEETLPPQGIAFETFPISIVSDPVSPKIRSVPANNRPLLEAELNDLLRQQIIEPTESTFLSPIIMAKKSDGSLRLCVDYSNLNSVTADIHFPIEEPRQLLDSLKGQAFFATLDLRSGFHQVLLDQNASQWTAFSTHKGAYRYKRLPFGLKNAPRFFQAAMTSILRPILGKGAQVFIDDIIVYGSSWSEFLDHLHSTLSLLQSANVRLKRSKCTFGLTEVQYLGYIVNGDGLHLSDERLQGLKDIPLPRTKTALRSFLGLCNYYRSFVSHLAELVLPLQDLLNQTKTKVPWSPALEQQFDSVKARLAEATTLSHPDYSQPLFVRCDASDLGVGGVLFQVTADGVDRPIAFVSKSFNQTQKNWAVIDRELYAIIYSLERFRHYIYGATFVLDTDHRNLLFLESTKSAKLLRWREKLLEYSFVLRHIPGDQNVVADALSRIYAITAEPAELDILRSIHNSVVGHRKFKHCLEVLKERQVSWPSMVKDLKEFLASCPSCQKHKDKRQDDEQGSILCSEPFDSIAIDTMGPFPASADDMKYVIVLIDEFSRFVELVPARDVSARSAANAILQVFGRFGAPRQIKSDNGTQFTAQVIQELLALLNVSHNYSLPYRPQSNAMVERANREILKHLRHLVYDLRDSSNWPLFLPLVQRIVNATPHALTNICPAQVVYGNRISIDRGLLQPFASSTVEVNSEYVKTLSDIQSTLLTRIQDAQSKYIADRVTESDKHFAPGSLVLIPFPTRPNKLAAKWQGPFEVVSQDSTHTYTLRHLTSQKMIRTHVSDITPYVDSLRAAVDTAARDSDEWEVERIVSHSGSSKRTLRFKIRWTGYDSSFDSDLTLRQVQELRALDDYLVGHPALRRLVEGGKG
jgi:transposase InsO family protein